MKTPDYDLEGAHNKSSRVFHGGNNDRVKLLSTDVNRGFIDFARD
jgi:hypothetical protein